MTLQKNIFRRALDIKPDYKPASNNLQKIFRELNQLDSVTNFIRGSSLFDEDSPAFLADMGKTFFDQKRYDSARFYMRKAVNKDPDNVQYYNTLGLSFQGLKLYDSARVNLQKAN